MRNRIVLALLAGGAVAATVIGFAGFAVGVKFGAMRGKAEFLAQDLEVRFPSSDYSRLDRGCTLAIYLASYLNAPSVGAAANVQSALVDPGYMLDIDPFLTQQARVSDYLRSPWLLHKYDALADEVDRNRIAIARYDAVVHEIAAQAPFETVVPPEKRRSLDQAVQELGAVVQAFASLEGESPRKWNCVAIN